MSMDSRFLETETRIKYALIELLKIKKFEYITISNLVNKAKISRSTFYNHYKNKYELINYYQEFFVKNSNEIFSQNINKGIAQTAYAMFLFLENEGILLGLFLNRNGSLIIRKKMIELLRKNAEMKILNKLEIKFTKERDKKRFVLFISNVLISLMQEWLDNPQNDITDYLDPLEKYININVMKH